MRPIGLFVAATLALCPVVVHAAAADPMDAGDAAEMSQKPDDGYPWGLLGLLGLLGLMRRRAGGDHRR